jgi:hypothetical protein
MDLPSYCPECGEMLVARRGELVAWHWAHRPGPADRTRCSQGETDWHLKWKLAYLNLPGWEVEYPVEIEGRNYRLDAFNPTTGRVREFVHSLSDDYAPKHAALAASGMEVLWLFDGDAFASERRSECRKGGIRRLLKPRAAELLEKVGPSLAHLEDGLWRHWKENVWYPLEGKAAWRLLENYRLAGQAIEAVTAASEEGVLAVGGTAA